MVNSQPLKPVALAANSYFRFELNSKNLLSALIQTTYFPKCDAIFFRAHMTQCHSFFYACVLSLVLRESVVDVVVSFRKPAVV